MFAKKSISRGASILFIGMLMLMGFSPAHATSSASTESAKVPGIQFVSSGNTPGMNITVSNAGDGTTTRDIILVIDTSPVMAYETDPAGNPLIGEVTENPEICNAHMNDPAHRCEPLGKVIDAAVAFVDELSFPYDRVALVSSTGQNLGNAAREPVTILNFSDDSAEVKAAIRNLKVYQPARCPLPLANHRDFLTPCLYFDPDYIQQICIPRLLGNLAGELDPTTCGSSNIGGGLYEAGYQFANARQDSFRAVIALFGGPANASNPLNHPDGICDNTIWVLPGGSGFCRGEDDLTSLGWVPPATWDASATTTAVAFDWSAYDPVTHPEQTTRHHIITSTNPVTYPADYDADDFARDGADYVTAPSPNGQGATLFSICVGNYCKAYPNVNDPASGELLGRYMAYHAGGVNANHGNYYLALDADLLPPVFQVIAGNMNAVPSISWAKSMGGTGLDAGYRIAVDSSGNVYTTGFFSGTADFDPGAGVSNLTSAGSNDIFVSKLNSSGDFVWAKSMGGTGGDEGHDITVDSSGNVYVAGFFSDTADFDPGAGTSNLISAGSVDISVSKLDSSGDFVWAKSMGGTGFDNVYCIAVDSSGNVYTSGFFDATVDFDPGVGISNLISTGNDDIFVSKLNSNGGFVWTKSMGGTSYDGGFGITVDSSGNVYTSGAFSGTADFDPGTGTSNLTSAGGYDSFVSKLDNSGDFVWAKNMGGTSDDRSSSITIDASGNVYTTGAFSGTADFDPGTGTSNLTSAGGYDSFVSKLDNSGNFVWAKSMGGTDYDQGNSITIDSSRNIYTTGWFYGTVDFDPGAGTSNLTSAGGYDSFVSKLDNSGEFVWAKSMGGTDDDGAYGITVDPSGNVYTTGAFQGTADFDPGTGTFNLTSAGSDDIFVHKLENEVTLTPQELIVTKTADTNDGVCDSDCSLREAIAVASTGDTINFDSNLAGQTIHLASTLLIDKGLTIDGSSLASHIHISGDTDNDGIRDVSVFRIEGTAPVELNGLDIVKGNSGIMNIGGGIFNLGNLTITNTNISGNSSWYGGGGVLNDNDGILTIVNSTISNNSAPEGSGILNLSPTGTVNISNSTLSGNYVRDNDSGNGGGIENWGFLTATNVTLLGNSATFGGGIINFGTSTVINSTISGNFALTSGGGIFNAGGIPNHDDGILTIENSTISNNSASSGGGMANSGTLNYANTIIANSTSGGDCLNDEQFGTINTNIHNLVGDGSCSASLSGDPNLGELGDNGGPTYTMALLLDSPAINAGDNATCEITDQRGITRPQGTHCDIGAFEYVDNIPPSVSSIVRKNITPTSTTSADFTVTFSEPVTGVDMVGPQFDDFTLTTSLGVSGASITGVSGSDTTYIVTINTGSGNGTIRLDIPTNATIVDLAGNLLGSLPFTSGETYTITKSSTFSSAAANDGWVLETGESTNSGGAKDANGFLRVGDDAQNKQYRSILYFNTSNLPDNAIPFKVTLKIKRAGTVSITTHGDLLTDMAKGFFGRSALDNTDFQAQGVPKPNMGSLSPVAGEPGWYQLVLSPANLQYINLIGVTQFRLRFARDDDNDRKADFTSFYSGEDVTNPPQLIVEYTTP